MNIAIDGPAGAGKSTIAKIVAAKLKYIYVDTGAMYRAMALYLLREQVDRQDATAIAKKCLEPAITIQYVDGQQQVMLNGENVNGLIRTAEVTNMASISSAVPQVRTRLVALQQEMAAKENVVMDGRDIGTVVLPDAEVKVYLTASVDVRAMRRYKELLEKGEAPDLETLKKDIAERDHRDMTRETSPLKQAKDAVVIDSSDMNIEEAAAAIMALI